MSTTAHHQQLKDLLVAGQPQQAQALWLELADAYPAQPEFLLLLIQEFAHAGHGYIAGDLASLLTDNLKATGKLHEWLDALKLRAAASATDNALRAELADAYTALHPTDPRLKTIFAVAALDQPATRLPDAIQRIDILLALAPNAYCQHKSWGFGRIKQFDATLGRLVVGFPHNPDHPLQLAYAAESLIPVSPDHLEVRKLTDLPGLQQLATSDALALLRLTLAGHGHALLADRLEQILTPAIIPSADWKKWWDNTKKLAKRNPHFDIPARKTDPVKLRPAPVSQQDELLAAFQEARDLPGKTAAAQQLLHIADEIADPGLLLHQFEDGLLAALPAATKPVARLEAAATIAGLRAHQKTPDSGDVLLTETLAGIADLPAVIADLSTAARKRVIALLKATQPDRLLAHLNALDAKLLDELPDLLGSQAAAIAQHVQNQTASRELLLWLCREFTSPKAPAWLDQVPGTALLAAVVNAIETAEYRSDTKRLRDVLLGNDDLITELLASAPPDVIRNHARALLASRAFEELDRRSLMARLVKEFPFVQDLLVSKPAAVQPLIVSWPSLRRRQAELEDIVQNKIPQNSKEIGVARSYGDLRENFEFKAAKDLQKVLMRRRAELEMMLVRAQGTDFANTKTDVAGIGTSVTVTDVATGQPQTYHILGAWDSDTARNIISYPAALAQALFNKRAGDTVECPGETGKIQLRVDRIEKVPTDILQSL